MGNVYFCWVFQCGKLPLVKYLYPSTSHAGELAPEICRGQVHGARKERRITRTRRRRIIIIIRNGAKTISLQTLFGRLKKLLNILKRIINTQLWEISMA